MDLTDIYRTFCPAATEDTYIPSTHETLSRIDKILWSKGQSYYCHWDVDGTARGSNMAVVGKGTGWAVNYRVLSGKVHLEELSLLPAWCGILELSGLVLYLMAQAFVSSSHLQACLGTTGTSTIGPRAIESPTTQSRNMRWYTPLPTLRSTWGKHTVHICGS